jgi:hypothetical protein
MKNETIEILKAKAEELFHNALCNKSLDSIGLEISYDSKDYVNAKKELENPCYEDVLMQILRDGKTLKLNDWESNTYNEIISLEKIHNNVFTAPPHIIGAYFSASDDADTANDLIQWVAYKEIIFG